MLWGVSMNTKKATKYYDPIAGQMDEAFPAFSGHCPNCWYRCPACGWEQNMCQCLSLKESRLTFGPIFGIQLWLKQTWQRIKWAVKL